MIKLGSLFILELSNVIDVLRDIKGGKLFANDIVIFNNFPMVSNNNKPGQASRTSRVTIKQSGQKELPSTRTCLS